MALKKKKRALKKKVEKRRPPNPSLPGIGPEDTPSHVTPVGTYIVGFTGAFGSGCTTASKHVRDDFGFTLIALSEEVRKEWGKQNPSKKVSDAPRDELQQVGDQLREQFGGAVLVERALKALPGKRPTRIAIDGIRNGSEIAYLRKEFGFDFTLIAVLADVKERWSRIRTTYTDIGRTETDFQQDDLRDQDEDTKHGQQVNLCVDMSDVFVANSKRTNDEFRDRVSETIKLLTEIERRPPTADEVMMHMAFSSAHASQCLKRHVGAVVTDSLGQVAGVGYNENPLNTNPCAHEPAYGRRCFRDIIREEHFSTLTAQGANCPACGELLPVMKAPPWFCPACRDKGVKTNLEAHFFPDRAMWWCTAIHAEARALALAGEKARGGKVYTTTFPCFQCTEKIKQAGVTEVIYTDPYPDPPSEARLRLQGIGLNRFEGVRSSSFERIFKLAK